MSGDICYQNGSLIGLSQAKIAPLDGGLLRGEGVFETLLVVGGEAHDVDAGASTRWSWRFPKVTMICGRRSPGSLPLRPVALACGSR